uniref:Uncharacterized protein n=1 Tax=Siphoviridae sp. cttpk5 TaxID=2826496 RepID=A0A8S5NHM9_9CAUD|nr:MAG TPA: hypothetical protein [Siphoviridae sp. cttpk5]
MPAPLAEKRRGLWFVQAVGAVPTPQPYPRAP